MKAIVSSLNVIVDANELTDLVQQMLTQMQSRFNNMSDNIVKRIDDMGGRIDELEKSIGDLVNDANNEENAIKAGN